MINNSIFRFLLSNLFVLSFILANGQFNNQNQNGEYFFANPIFAGDYPDPSILRDGDDYYIVHSSFVYYPGLLIWHSKNLINWEPVTHALFKNIGSVWAPDLVKYNGKYYIYFPANNTNYVVWADNIRGPWSDPVDLKIGSIDPGHITDNEGNRYLYFSNGSYVRLSKDGLKVISEPKVVYTGWQIPREWSIECFCLEGPKLIKRGDYYYLIVAEGGTAGPPTSHMVLCARSRSPLGPWENSPYNPVIKTWDRSERWWSTGHGTLFCGPNQKWWLVFHGYENGHINMGRQTLLQPVEWTTDNWAKIAEGTKTESKILKPFVGPLKSPLSLSDNFNQSTLGFQWKFYKDYDPSRYKLIDNSLIISGRGSTMSDCSPLLCSPVDHSYSVQVELFIEGNAFGGLSLFYSEKAFSGIVADNENILAVMRNWQFITESQKFDRHVFLKLVNINDVVDMYYSLSGENWKKIEPSLEVSSYNHNSLNDFLSLKIGLCAYGNGVVKFKNFIYKSL